MTKFDPDATPQCDLWKVKGYCSAGNDMPEENFVYYADAQIVERRARVAEHELEQTKKKMTNHISDNIHALKIEQITELNKYHDAPEKAPRYAAVRDACSDLMKVIVENCPECADRTTALQTVRLVRMWANSSLALEEIGK